MKQRTLGQGLTVSAIGIGCMPMIREGNINYGHADDDESIRTIHEAIDLGLVAVPLAAGAAAAPLGAGGAVWLSCLLLAGSGIEQLIRRRRTER